MATNRRSRAGWDGGWLVAAIAAIVRAAAVAAVAGRVVKHAYLMAGVDTDHEIVARHAGSPHEILVDLFDNRGNLLLSRLALEEQQAVDVRERERELQPRERLLAGAEQVRLGRACAVEPVVAQVV